MSSLYEIDQAILSAVDSETGEIIDPEKLDALFMEREKKIESVALWIKNLQSDAIAYKVEKDAFAERQKKAEDKIASLKKWLTEALSGQAFNTAKCAVSFRASERVEIPDESIVPKEFLRKTTTYAPDKMAIKEAIKAGQQVDGCALVRNTSIQIK